MQKDTKLTAEVMQLRTSSTKRMSLEILSDWLQIITLFAIYIIWPTWWLFIPVFILMGAKQYSLLVLLHDAQHTLLHQNRKINDRLATWLLAAPFGVMFSKSRFTHIQHHQYLGTGENDPDYPLYCINEPEPKNTQTRFFLHFLRQVLFAKLIRNFLPGKKVENKANKKSTLNLTELFAVLTCQVLIFLSLAATGFWYLYVALWLIPLISFASLLNDARIFCEHSNPQTPVAANRGLLISYISNPIERFFFSPHHMNYHAEHHIYPFIPHYNLPKIRSILIRSTTYQNQLQWRSSYLRHIREYLTSLNNIPENHQLEQQTIKQPN